MRIYYPKQINKDIPIAAVLQMYGITPDNHGRVKCPDIHHDDKHPSAVIYENSNMCCCFSCGAKLNPIDIVMQREDLKYPQACEALIERFGLDIDAYSEYQMSDRERKIIEEQKAKGNTKFLKQMEEANLNTGDAFPFTPQEINLIGLSMSVTIKKPYNMDNNGNVLVDTSVYTLYAFWRDDRELVEEMFRGKICETAERLCKSSLVLQDLLKSYSFSNDEKKFEKAQGYYDKYMETGEVPPPYSVARFMLYDFYQYKDFEKSLKETEEEIEHLKKMYEKVAPSKAKDEKDEKGEDDIGNR